MFVARRSQRRSFSAMSLAHTPQSVVCEQCGSDRDPHSSIHGSFCSEGCYYRHKGQKLLDQIDHHREICSTCYVINRDLHPIPKETCSAGTALQYPNQYTVIGLDEREGPNAYHRLEHGRFSCSCGIVDTNELDATIQNVELDRAIPNFVRALEYLYRKHPDRMPGPPDRDRYFAALNRHWRDAAYAAGYAVYGP